MIKILTFTRVREFVSVVLSIAIITYPTAIPLKVIAESEPTDNSQSAPVANESNPTNTPAVQEATTDAVGTINKSTPPEPTKESVLVDEDPNSLVQPSEPIADIASGLSSEYDQVSTNKQIIENTESQIANSGNISVEDSDDIKGVATGNTESSVKLTNISNNVTNTNPGSSSDIKLLGATSTDVDIKFDLQPSDKSVYSSGITDQESAMLAIIHDTDIINDVTVYSESGQVDLINNDDIGSVRSGGAISTVDILNLANSVVSSGDIMVGVINIDGDYNGNIILGQDILNKLMASSSNPQSTFSSYSQNKADEQLIVNDISVDARTGTINSAGNDSVDVIKTGTAYTDVIVNNILNGMTIYDNSLLVIINTLSEWNGDVLGTKGPGILLLSVPKQDGSELSSLNVNNSSAELDIYSSTSIFNRVNASSKSGNITLLGNDDIDSASSGNATTRVRVVNTINHVISFADWFGILFINVFGNWDGSIIQEPIILNSPDIPTQGSSTPTPTVPKSILVNISNGTLEFSSTSQGLGFNPTNAKVASTTQASPSQTLVESATNSQSPIVAGISNNNSRSSGSNITTWAIALTTVALGGYAIYRLQLYRQSSLDSLGA